MKQLRLYIYTHTHTLGLLKNEKKQRGITLIALIVTIVILLILAGITLIYVLGDNGILKAAQEAKNQTEAAIRNEQQSLGELANQLKEMYGGGNGNNNQGGNTENPVPDTPDKPTGPIVDDSTSSDHTATTLNYTWEQIDKIAQAIANSSNVTNETTEVTANIDGTSLKVGVGDIATVQYNGTNVRVRVLGFKHDDLVNSGVYGGNHSKASISFEFLDFMTGSTYKPMNSSNTNSGGWADTEMRTFLNGTEGKEKLSNKAYIKQVKKKYIAKYNSASSVTTCNDYLWLLAASEIVNSGYQNGAYGYAITSEGPQYQYYKSMNPTWNTRNTVLVKKPTESGGANPWWLRSTRYYYDTSFCYVTNSGNATGTTASTNGGVAPGFGI